jgi:hypothetical protein
VTGKLTRTLAIVAAAASPGAFRPPSAAGPVKRYTASWRHEQTLIYGIARITEGGAAELLQKLARAYLGPVSASRPWITRRPALSASHITVDRVSGVGSWAQH